MVTRLEAMSTTTTPLLDEQGYYGQADFRPLSGCKKICVYIVCIILFVPAMLLSLIFTAIFCCFVKMSNNQIQSAKVLGFDAWFKAPGKKLDVKLNGNNTSDILISSDFVDKNGYLHTCGGLGFSLRKSLNYTVDSHLREGPYGRNFSSDTDVDRPRCLLNGSIYPYDPKYDEIWCSWSQVGCHWPAIYSWSPHLPEGWSWSSITQKIRMDSLPDVLGYVHYFEVTNKKFYDTDRIVKVGQECVNCPTITPEYDGKIFARYNYSDGYYFGNIKRSQPDAYIFKGNTIEDAGIKLLHTYRVMRPPMTGTSLPAKP